MRTTLNPACFMMAIAWSICSGERSTGLIACAYKKADRGRANSNEPLRSALLPMPRATVKKPANRRVPRKHAQFFKPILFTAILFVDLFSNDELAQKDQLPGWHRKFRASSLSPLPIY